MSLQSVLAIFPSQPTVLQEPVLVTLSARAERYVCAFSWLAFLSGFTDH